MNINDIALSQLSQDELKSLAARAIRLIQNPQAGIGTELFEASLTIIPQTCVEAIVVDDLENPNHVYLTWREDEHYRGWHCPGTFIRFGESFEDALHRVLAREIRSQLRNYQETNVQYNRVDTRGHTIGTVWLVQGDVWPAGGQWFPIHQLPNPTLEHHISIIQRVLASKS